MGNKILESVKMSNSVKSSCNPEQKRATPQVEKARDAAVSFLKKMPDVEEVKVTKMAPIDAAEGTSEVEADVYVPNATIKSLGLPVTKKVLDCQTYLLRLDSELNVTAFSLKNSVEVRNES